MADLVHIVDSANFKRLQEIHLKLTFNKEYGQAFRNYLAQLETSSTKRPSSYDELETLYKKFSDQYAKTH